MPIAVTKYTCQFKCGRQAKESKKSVEEHEAKCWNNPGNSTCKSCKFEDYFIETEDYGGYGFREWRVRACKHPDGDKIPEEMYDGLKIDDMHIKPVVNCPHWTPRL